jgi:predicted nuclease with TOPRIM domain
MFWEALLQNLPTVILIILALIICGAELIRAIRIWKEERQNKINQQTEERQKEFDMQKEFDRLHERFDEIDKRLDNLELRMSVAEERLSDLTISDMHDIKSWIVEQYHKFYTEQGWIDAFNAETIDRRYSDYKKEGGNSYIAVLIDRLHSLPMDPPPPPIKNNDLK